ncbi:MAG TPA: hypothetical protein VG758_04605, partial [Hyphomicrobiaceae bacterium]|nr:hypothetical protein [Hyphomicrobiaceae bacterium]
MAQTPLAAPSAGPAAADTGAGRIRTYRVMTAGLLAAAFAGLAVPVLLAEIPPLLDYPNHLVRLWLIAGGAEIEPLSRMYAVSWTSAHTNVGIDYLA